MKLVQEQPFVKIAYEKSIPPLLHPLLGMPAIPGLGKYLKSSYILPNTLAVIGIDLGQVKDTGQYTIFQNKQRQFKMPNIIINILRDMPEQIPRNRPPKPKPDCLQFQPLKFQYRGLIRFYIIFSQQQNQKKPQNYNIVPHPFIFKHQQLDYTKKHISFVNCCLIPIQGAMKEWQKDRNFIKFGEFRSQYISYHLKAGAPAFSPNNLKLRIDTEQPRVVFFEIILAEDQIHNVFLHIHSLNKQNALIIKSILQTSDSVQKLIQLIQNTEGKTALTVLLKQIFQYL